MLSLSFRAQVQRWRSIHLPEARGPLSASAARAGDFQSQYCKASLWSKGRMEGVISPVFCSLLSSISAWASCFHNSLQIIWYLIGVAGFAFKRIDMLQDCQLWSQSLAKLSHFTLLTNTPISQWHCFLSLLFNSQIDFHSLLPCLKFYTVHCCNSK